MIKVSQIPYKQMKYFDVKVNKLLEMKIRSTLGLEYVLQQSNFWS